MKELFARYLKDHETAWSTSTMKSEASRLRGLEDIVEKGPESVYKSLKARGQQPYTIKTTFMRLCSIEAWAILNGESLKPEFKEFVRKHRNRFKHAYQKEEVGMDYDEVMSRIEMLPEPYKTQALGMLKTGVRLFESYNVKNGHVVGKGEKPRKVFGTIKKTAPRSSFSRQLKAVGLKSHMLRKLCATKLVENGATAADLCKVFGWRHIQTAYNYLQAKDDVRLQALIQKATEEP